MERRQPQPREDLDCERRILSASEPNDFWTPITQEQLTKTAFSVGDALEKRELPFCMVTVSWDGGRHDELRHEFQLPSIPLVEFTMAAARDPHMAILR